MKIKKILCILLCAVLLVSASSCKNDDKVEDSSVDSVSEESSSESSGDEAQTIPDEEVERFNNLIESEYEEDLEIITPAKEYTYQADRPYNFIMEAGDRYYIIEDIISGGISKSKVTCRKMSDDSELWTKSFGGNNITSIASGTLLENGDIVLAGATSATEGTFSNLKKIRDNAGIVFCLDKNGNQKWIDMWDTEGHESFSKSVLASDGQIIISGTYTDDDNSYIIVRSYDENGNQKWEYERSDISSIVDMKYNGDGQIGLLFHRVQYSIAMINAKDGSENEIIEISDAGTCSLITFMFMDDKIVLGGRFYDSNYYIGESLVDHDELHDGTADISYNRYGPLYILCADLKGNKVFDYFSYAYIGGIVEKVWQHDGKIYAIGRRYNTQTNTEQSGLAFAGEMVLYELNTGGELLSRKAIKGSYANEEGWYYYNYIPNGNNVTAVKQIPSSSAAG